MLFLFMYIVWLTFMYIWANAVDKKVDILQKLVMLYRDNIDDLNEDIDSLREDVTELLDKVGKNEQV